MPYSKVTGIVTRYVDYRESDRILSLFTLERGRVDVCARGCRNPKSALLPAAQQFAYGEFELYSGKGKTTLSQANVLESFYPIREDIERYAVASSVLQLAHEAAQEEEENRRLFFLMYYTLSFLAYGEAAPDDLLLCFLTKYLDVIGYRPVIVNCAHCGTDLRDQPEVFYSLSAGGAVCGNCSTGAKVISKTALEAVRRMLLLGESEMDRVRISQKIRDELEPVLVGQVNYCVEYGTKALAFYSDFKDQTSYVNRGSNKK